MIQKIKQKLKQSNNLYILFFSIIILTILISWLFGYNKNTLSKFIFNSYENYEDNNPKLDINNIIKFIITDSKDSEDKNASITTFKTDNKITDIDTDISNFKIFIETLFKKNNFLLVDNIFTEPELLEIKIKENELNAILVHTKIKDLLPYIDRYTNYPSLPNFTTSYVNDTDKLIMYISNKIGELIKLIYDALFKEVNLTIEDIKKNYLDSNNKTKFLTKFLHNYHNKSNSDIAKIIYYGFFINIFNNIKKSERNYSHFITYENNFTKWEYLQSFIFDDYITPTQSQIEEMNLNILLENIIDKLEYTNIIAESFKRKSIIPQSDTFNNISPTTRTMILTFNNNDIFDLTFDFKQNIEIDTKYNTILTYLLKIYDTTIKNIENNTFNTFTKNTLPTGITLTDTDNTNITYLINNIGTLTLPAIPPVVPPIVPPVVPPVVLPTDPTDPPTTTIAETEENTRQHAIMRQISTLYDEGELSQELQDDIKTLSRENRRLICRYYCNYSSDDNKDFCESVNCIASNYSVPSQLIGDSGSALGFSPVNNPFSLLDGEIGTMSEYLQSGPYSRMFENGDNMSIPRVENNGNRNKLSTTNIIQKDTEGVSNIFAPNIYILPKKTGQGYMSYMSNDPNSPEYRNFLNNLQNIY